MTDLVSIAGYSKQQRDAIADEMNAYPRKTLAWASSIEFSSVWLARLQAYPNTIQ